MQTKHEEQLPPRQLRKSDRPLAQYWYTHGPCGIITRAALRTLQFVLAAVVAALYAVDLHRASKAGAKGPTNWVFAEVAACLSALTCIVHVFVTVKHVTWAIWDFVVAMLWAACFGVFATIYLAAEPSGGPDLEEYRSTLSVTRMQAAVWIDMINMLLWLATFIAGVGWCCRARRVTRKTDVELEPMDK